MSDVPNVQADIIGQLQTLLAGVPGFGAEIREDNVLDLIDAEDEELPDQLIVLQEGDTSELDRSGATVREELTINIVAMTRLRDHAQPLRAARLDIKRALKGIKAGFTVDGLIKVAFPTSAPRYPDRGRRWAFRVIPITVTYVQQL
ncbi:hypothetical protein QA447_03530 [Pseudomonas sp. abacavir_1]